MTVSVFDMFSVGIGPSSSHTVGPMRAACRFVEKLADAGILEGVTGVRAEMFGSLGVTGPGHGTPAAVMLGLEGERPDLIEVDSIGKRVAAITESKTLSLLGRVPIAFDPGRDLLLHRRRTLPGHPNGMRFEAHGTGGLLQSLTCYSVGGGFVVDEAEMHADAPAERRALPRPFRTAAELLDVCERDGLAISDVMLANETTWRTEAEIRAGLLHVWAVMQECVSRGCRVEGILPGGLRVPRRAPELHRRLCEGATHPGALDAMDWVNLYALAVNEENAAGGRVVTAPTNGAAGVVPAVLHYYRRFVPGASDDGVVRFLLTAGAIGTLFKHNASISGAEVGCQGEIGSACSMAAAGLCEVLGGSPAQVENAAEIAMEHNLGLTCDPVGGLVQIPCIERNAMAAVKAINAAHLALNGDGAHLVSLDRVIRTMRDTGADMKTKYKETARGGLAVDVVPVNVIEC